MISDAADCDSMRKRTPLDLLSPTSANFEAKSEGSSTVSIPDDVDWDESEEKEDDGGLSDKESSSCATRPLKSLSSVSCDGTARDIKGQSRKAQRGL